MSENRIAKWHHPTYNLPRWANFNHRNGSKRVAKGIQCSGREKGAECQIRTCAAPRRFPPPESALHSGALARAQGVNANGAFTWWQYQLEAGIGDGQLKSSLRSGERSAQDGIGPPQDRAIADRVLTCFPDPRKQEYDLEWTKGGSVWNWECARREY